MVRFVTTAYTHMYENSYTGRSSLDRGPSRSKLGSRVEKLCKQYRLSVRDIARFLGISPEKYQEFLNGRYRLSQEQLEELADLLGVKTSELFGSSGGKKSVPAQKPEMMDIRPLRRGDRTPKKTSVNRDKVVKKTSNVGALPVKAYDPDEAAALLAKRFGSDKVARMRG